MRWGVIGASQIAETVVSAIAALPGQQLVGVCSGSAARAAEFASQHGVAGSTTDMHELLAQPLDAVYIGSTNERHHAQTLAALDAGYHVMCEKPLAMTQPEAAEMVRRAGQRGKLLATNHHQRARPCHVRMRELIEQGAIGDVHGVQVSHAVFLRQSLQGWRIDNPGAGGGVVLDIMVHNADLLRYLLGREPRRIATFTQQFGMGKGKLEDGAMSVIEFDGGVLAQTHQSFVAANARTRLHVLGTRGTLYAVGSLSPAGDATLTLRDDAGDHEEASPTVNLYEVAMRAFVDACAGRGAPLADGADGAKSLAVALAALRSAESGRAETIDFGL